MPSTSASTPTPRTHAPRLALAAIAALVLVLAVVPSAGAFVYWTADSYVPNANGDEDLTTTIGRAAPDGSGVVQHFIDPGVTGSGISAGAKALYWGSHSGSSSSRSGFFGAVGRSNLDGSGVDTALVTAVQNSRVLGATADSRYVYWATDLSRAGGQGDHGAIGRASLDGSGAKLDFIGLADSRPSRVAVDAGHVYWNDYPKNRIGRAVIDGTGVDASFISTGIKLDEFGLAVDAQHIYWANGTTIGRAKLDGSGVEPAFIANAGSGVTDIAVDASHIYWVNGMSIARSNVDGSNVEKSFIAVVPGGNDPSIGSLAVDRPVTTPPTGGGFTPGTPSLNTTSGTATVRVKVTAAGKVAVSGTGVKSATTTARASGSVKLTIKPTGAAKRTLDKTGKVKLSVKVTFTPSGGKASTKTVKVTLKKRR